MNSGFGDKKEFYHVENTHVDMKSLLKCTLCPNMCRFECPTLRVTQKETYAPATKARITYHMKRGNLDEKDLHTAEVAYVCTNCDGCKIWCPMDISLGDLLRDIRADLIDKEIFIPSVKEFNDKLIKKKTAFSEKTFSTDPTYSFNMENPEVFYYIGCVMAEKKGDAVRSSIEILKKAGVKFCTFAEERQCCGGPLYTLGFQSTVRDFARKNIELFTRSGITTLISDCPMCTLTIDTIYKKLGFNHKFKVLTTVEYFKNLIEKGKIKLTELVRMSVTYHDPCISARKLNDINSARFILNKIPGLELKEAFLHGKETQCCGMGGVSHVHHPELSEEIGKQRFEQLIKTGAEKIVSSCPECENSFMRYNPEKILDISEILAKSLKKV